VAARGWSGGFPRCYFFLAAFVGLAGLDGLAVLTVLFAFTAATTFTGALVAIPADAACFWAIICGDQLGREAADRIRVGDDGLGVVLCLEIPARRAVLSGQMYPLLRPTSCRSFAGHLAVRHEPFVWLIWWVADCPINELSACAWVTKVGVEEREVLFPIQIQKSALVRSAGLAFVQCHAAS